MYESPRMLIENLLAPMVSVQIFLAVLIYFTIVRKRMAADYKLYVCFLVTFILFLVGRAVQEFCGSPVWQIILFVRMILLFAVGIPSLLVAAAVQSGVRKTRVLFIWPYAVGILISVGYVVCADAGMQQFFFTEDLFAGVFKQGTVRVAHKIQIAGAVVMLVLPCGGLLVKEWKNGRNRKLLAFLFGAFLFGVLFVVGTVIPRGFWIYYVGSIFSALCWSWAVFQDIRDLKGKVGLLKEELQLRIQSGKGAREPEFEQLLKNLEELSPGNLDVYKMRIREILSTLTDATIQAGGDTDALILRNTERGHAIESSTDSQAIREMFRSEAVELSEMMADIPEQKASQTIERAVAYLDEHYGDDLSVEELAASLGISRSHFMREFKKGTGWTVNQYLTSVRIAKAKVLLTEKSVTETAFEVGYNNSNYFSTVFKKKTGLSPVEFQKTLKV